MVRWINFICKILRILNENKSWNYANGIIYLVSKSQDLLKTYYELGHTKIDTAQMYPVPSTLNKFCLTEEIIGTG